MENIPDIGMELTGSDEVVEETPAVETPSTEEPAPEEAVVETPEAPEEVAVEEAPEETLYETPDGRKVDAATLQREWKENFLPEFTRKSQALAKYESEKNLNNQPKNEPEWKSPDYVPGSYAELVEVAKAEAIAEIQNSTKAEQERVASIQQAVEEEISSLKAKDPSLDENSLFQHANKYGFHNLSMAHANMMDMKKTIVDVEQRTVKNLKNREADPISTTPRGDIAESSGYDPSEMSQYDGAAEYLASLKAKK